MKQNYTTITAKPFIKWAGGKSQLLDRIRVKYPINKDININKYCEPFIGGGAVFFDVIRFVEFDEILINDINIDLMDCYKTIQKDVLTIIEILDLMQNIYINSDDEERKKYYYSNRKKFNELKTEKNQKNIIEKSAVLIFLNKTCFNGLYRVNSKGIFNVPMGDYKNPLICDKENLKAVSNLLNNVDIRCGDYSKCLDFIDKKTFVYIDPPYRPLNKTANFTSYNEFQFEDNEQIRLGHFVDLISEVGAKVVLSNSDPKNINESDTFFDNLYRNHNIERITAKRMINSNSENRGIINEILVTNF